MRRRDRPLAQDFSIGHNGRTPLADFDAFFTSAVAGLTPNIYEPAKPRRGARLGKTKLSDFSISHADADQVRATLASLYGENRFSFLGDDRRARVALHGRSAGGVSVIRARFSAPFRLSLEGLTADDGGLAIFLRTKGSARVQTSDRVVACEQGRWVPFATGAAREVETSHDLADTAIIIAPSLVNAACRSYLGADPAEPLKFDSSPLAPFLAARWTEIVGALDALTAVHDCPVDAVASIAEHGVSLLLDRHPHNFARYRRSETAHDASDAGGLPTSGQAAQPTLTGTQVEVLRSYISASLDGRIDVPALANLVGMGTTRFAAAFRRAFGTPPGHYVRDERLRRAMWLLEHETMTIAAVAAEAGFSSQSHLVTRMLAVAGVTPREYRRSRRDRRDADG
jgi:AraC-like DNA-binding protein